MSRRNTTRNKNKLKPRHNSAYSDLLNSSSSYIGVDIIAKSDVSTNTPSIIPFTPPTNINNRRNSNSNSRPISARKHYFQQKNLYTGRSRSKLYYYSSSEREDDYNGENDDERPKFDRIHSDPNREKSNYSDDDHSIDSAYVRIKRRITLNDASLAPMTSTHSDSEICATKHKHNIFHYIQVTNDILEDEDYEYEDSIRSLRSSQHHRKRHSNSDVGPATNLKYYETMPSSAAHNLFNHKSHQTNNRSMDATAKMYSLKEMLTAGGSLQSLKDLDMNEGKESPSIVALSKRESVLNALREIGSRVFVKRGSQTTVKCTDIKDFTMDNNNDSIMWEFDLQICVMSARKNGDREEYEIEVTMNHETWIVYRTFIQFLEFDKNLRKEFKNAIKSNQMRIPSLPSNLKSTLFSNSNNDNTLPAISLILERKIYIELYLQTIVCLQNVRQWKNFMYFADIKHMHFGSSIMGRIHISDWEMGDTLDFDCNHTLQLKFSAKNIPINTHECQGCCLRISQFRNGNGNRSILMTTDFVIDHYHPRFSKCLIFEYNSTNFMDNELKVDLCLDFDSQMYSSYGSISVNVMYLLSNYNGYMQIPFVMDDHSSSFIPPDLYSKKSAASTSADEINKLPSKYRILKKDMSSPLVFPKQMENVQHAHIPTFCVAATLYQSRKSGKVLSMLGQNDTQFKSMQMPANLGIPRSLKHILYWNEALKKTVKHLLSLNTDSKEFRMGIITNCKSFINADYVCMKIDEQNVKENIAHFLLQLWKKLLVYYPNGNESFQDIILGCICKLSNRYEWDLAHVKYWQFVKQLNVYRAYTNIQWEKIMKLYMKLFVRTLDLCLDIIDSGLKTPAQIEFCKRILGLSVFRLPHMQRKMVALISTPLSILINTGKQERYEFLIDAYPDEQTAQGYVKPTWQDTYMHTIIQQTSYSSDSSSDTTDSIFMINNPSLNLSAWQWFTLPEVEYKTKIRSKKHTEFVEKYAWDIIKILVKNAAKFSHGCMQWKHVPLYLRIQELLVQAIIWPKLGSKASIQVLNFITELMSITCEMKYEIGNYAKALISNTDCIHPMQVELCFEYLREWISKCVISAGDHLLPDTFCYSSLIKATDIILHQKDWQIICVYFSFILHHSRLLNDHYRDCIFKEYLLEKELFKNFFCHWNTKLRKYYYMVLLYCVNRVGYFDEQRRNKYIRELNASQLGIGQCTNIYNNEMLESGHRIHVLFDNLVHLVAKKQSKFPSLTTSMSSLNLISVANQNLSLVNKNGRKISWASIVSDDERNEMQNLLCFSCNMNFVDRLECDRELMEMLNLEITKLKSKRKTNIEEKYRPYLDASFKQFSELCGRYSRFQLTVNCQKWQFGDVVIPTLIYKVRKHNQILDEFLVDTQNSVNGKFVQ